MKKPTPKQLRLSPETIRHLARALLKSVQGGAESGVNGNGLPFTCNGTCTCHD
jgi:hypothetical protein